MVFKNRDNEGAFLSLNNQIRVLILLQWLQSHIVTKTDRYVIFLKK
jgi:hypothetical protein